MTRCRSLVLVLAVLTALPGLVQAQERGYVTGSPGPGIPFLLEPVLPVPSLRLQLFFAPVGIEVNDPTADQPRYVGTELSRDDFLMPIRLDGVWFFSDSVVGEASLPFLVSFPGEGDNAFDIGNGRIGLEFPAVVAGGEQHRFSIALDLYLPFAQIRHKDHTAEEIRAKGGRYELATAALPWLAPDFSPETFTPVVGLHYRLRQGKIVTNVVLDAPIYIGFDYNQDTLFHEVWGGLRYGVEATYAARPVFPTLEVVGVTTFAHNDPSRLPGEPTREIGTETSLLVALGLRAAFGLWEPGVAVTYPIILGDENLNTTVYAQVELTYRFQ